MIVGAGMMAAPQQGDGGIPTAAVLDLLVGSALAAQAAMQGGGGGMEALGDLFRAVRKEIRDQSCTRAIIVAHNAHFDAGFLV